MSRGVGASVGIAAALLVAQTAMSFATGALRRDAAIAGSVRVCGGPAPGGCFTEPFGDCTTGDDCITTDRVLVLAGRRRVAEQRLSKARFQLRVPHGSYAVELIGDGSHRSHVVMQKRHVRVAAGHRATVTFLFAVP